MEPISPSEEEILRLVAMRETHRQARRFADSDKIREQLRNMGVELYDKDREWKCKDGRRGVLFTAGPTACMLTDDEIQSRIEEREEARSNKDFTKADQVRDFLRTNGVELDDKAKSWRTGDGRVGTYSGAVHSHLAGLPEEQIRALVAERERARAVQDFQHADEVRKHLLSLGVELFDNERVWRCLDGRQGTIVTGGADIVQCNLTDGDIQGRVQAREEARSRKDWASADMIRDELRRGGVELLDREEKWKTTDGRSGAYNPAAQPTRTQQMHMVQTTQRSAATMFSPPATSTDVMSPPGSQSMNAFTNAVPGAVLTTASIEALITGREAAREVKDFGTADVIRQDLRSHGVEVWDKQKTWKAVDGRMGPYPASAAPTPRPTQQVQQVQQVQQLTLQQQQQQQQMMQMAMQGFAPLPPPAGPPPDMPMHPGISPDFAAAMALGGHMQAGY
eukprot:TRINITY_DN1315_c0_g1_i1.p1 TRINITY_DN1315_c0_g1~~TRINITY_DN1315_c0_g1_i1.p1  ORF type:complete len:481 (+),score=115.80 TRINITY_DN1315_c0_g1_i1:95-1444(+)